MRDIIEAVQPGRSKFMKKGTLRRRVYRVKGPNHIWHIDGNDKLKPFGFCISGCMDGFSRKLMWLKVARTNKDPKLICSYFLKSVQYHNILPRVVRLDRGTENVQIADCQRLLRVDHTDSLAVSPVMFGSSVHNQRIERFWSYLRRVLLDDYRDLFKDYVEGGIIDTSNNIHLECLTFCFMPALRCELDSVFKSWNSHRVRQMNHSGCPSGIPLLLFDNPEIVGYEKQGKGFNGDVLRQCLEVHDRTVADCDIAFEEWGLNYLVTKNIALPTNINDAESLFSTLIVEVISAFPC